MAKSKNVHTSHAEGASSQGEHIFNALGDFAIEMADFIKGYIDDNATEDKKKAAALELSSLRTKAEELKKARDHESFRSGSQGDDQNAKIYSDFCNDIRLAVKNILSADKTIRDQGTASMALFKSTVEKKTVDETAKDSARGELSGRRIKDFDEWFVSTNSLLKPAFSQIAKAAIRVRQTYL